MLIKFALMPFKVICRDVIWPLTLDYDLDIEFGNINIVCDIPLNHDTALCKVLRNSHFSVFKIIAKRCLVR